MPKPERESRRKSNLMVVWAAVLGVCTVGLVGLAMAVLSGAFGFISFRLTILIIAAAVGVLGTTVQAINAALYHRSGFEHRRSGRY
jgi:hypothetical protein